MRFDLRRRIHVDVERRARRYEGEDNTYAFTRISEIIMEGDFVHAVDMGGPGDVTVEMHTLRNPSNRKGSNFVVCPGDENVYIKAAYLINPWGSCSIVLKIQHE